MKIDFSGLESSVSLCGADSDLCESFAKTPSFQLPDTLDVSLIILFHIWEIVSLWNCYLHSCFFPLVRWVSERGYPNGETGKGNNYSCFHL